MRQNRLDSFFAPIRMIDQLEREWRQAHRPATPALPVNVSYGENDATAVFEVPGVAPDQVDVQVDGHEVTVMAEREPTRDRGEGSQTVMTERAAGRRTRTLKLPFEIDAAGVTARVVDGRLHLELPRAEADKPARIAVTAG